jgi:hypothetical protein
MEYAWGNDEHQFSGSAVNQIIEGKTLFENLLTVDYEVTRDGIVESFSEIFECTPGNLTEITIEY